MFLPNINEWQYAFPFGILFGGIHQAHLIDSCFALRSSQLHGTKTSNLLHALHLLLIALDVGCLFLLFLLLPLKLPILCCKSSVFRLFLAIPRNIFYIANKLLAAVAAGVDAPPNKQDKDLFKKIIKREKVVCGRKINNFCCCCLYCCVGGKE